MLGTVTNESGMANDEVTLEQLKNKFELKASMERMSRLNAVEAEHPFRRDCQMQRRRSKQPMAKLMDATYTRLIFKQC